MLAGDASPAWMRAAGQALATALPHGTYRELPDQTHDVDAAVLAKALVEVFG